jgi:hypothetical protein
MCLRSALVEPESLSFEGRPQAGTSEMAGVGLSTSQRLGFRRRR